MGDLRYGDEPSNALVAHSVWRRAIDRVEVGQYGTKKKAIRDSATQRLGFQIKLR